jgi:hypothetical protein
MSKTFKYILGTIFIVFGMCVGASKLANIVGIILIILILTHVRKS